jgi:hypothetical protein
MQQHPPAAGIRQTAKSVRISATDNVIERQHELIQNRGKLSVFGRDIAGEGQLALWP